MNIDIGLIAKALTEAQWHSLFFVIIGVMTLTQAFKNIWFGFYPERRKGKKQATIWLAAVVMGVAGSIIGYLIGVPKQPTWFWVLSGAISGAASIGAYKLLIEVIWPKIKVKGV